MLRHVSSVVLNANQFHAYGWKAEFQKMAETARDFTHIGHYLADSMAPGKDEFFRYLVGCMANDLIGNTRQVDLVKFLANVVDWGKGPAFRNPRINLLVIPNILAGINDHLVATDLHRHEWLVLRFAEGVHFMATEALAGNRAHVQREAGQVFSLYASAMAYGRLHQQALETGLRFYNYGEPGCPLQERSTQDLRRNGKTPPYIEIVDVEVHDEIKWALSAMMDNLPNKAIAA